VVTTHVQPLNPAAQQHTLVIADGDKSAYLSKLQAMRDAARAGQNAPLDAMAVAWPAGGNANTGNSPA